MKQKFNNVIEKNGKLFTEGLPLFSSRAVSFEGKPYVEWEPGRSKLAAAVFKGVPDKPASSKQNSLSRSSPRLHGLFSFPDMQQRKNILS